MSSEPSVESNPGSEPDSFPTRPRPPRWGRALHQRWPFVSIGMTVIGLGFVWYAIGGGDRAIGLGVLPGCALVMIWMRGVFHFRVLLSEGEITGGVVGTDGVLRFRDSAGTEFVSRVGDGSRRGSVTVVFQASNPRQHRIVTPDDFA